MSVRKYEHHDDPSGVEYGGLIDALVEPPSDPESYIAAGGVLLARADEGEQKWDVTTTGRVRIAAEANCNWAKARPGTARALERYCSSKEPRKAS